MKTKCTCKLKTQCLPVLRSLDMLKGQCNISAMPTLKAYKYRLEPNSSQCEAFERYAGCCRFVWNWALDQRQQYYAATGKSMYWAEQDAQLKHLKKQFSFLGVAPSQSLQQVVKDLDRAYKVFFKEGRGFPRFKKKGIHDSFRVPQGFRVVGNYARLPKVGEVKFRLSRELEGVAKNITVSRRGAHWYASVQVEVIEPSNLIPFSEGSSVGIDMGVTTLATLSNGSEFHHLDFSQLERKRLRAQRSLSRKKKGSSNFRKAKARLSRIHESIANKRLDTLHKATTAISKNHAVVYVEALNTKSMSASARGDMEQPGKNVRAKAGLNRSILSQGWHEFKRQLGYKLEWNGGQLVEVNPCYTSQTCSGCGHCEKENRSKKKFHCLQCGHSEDADINAAKNILAVGQTVSACGDIGRISA